MFQSILRRIDPYLLLPLILISIFSLVVIYSGNPSLALQHMLFSLVGFVVVISMSFIDYRLFGRLSIIFYVTLLILLITVLFLGEEVRGSLRWIDIGSFRFQPSEFAKILLIISLSKFLSVKGKKLTIKRIIIAGILFVLPTILVFLQPDLGTSITFMAVGFGLLFIAGMPWWLIAVLVTTATASLPLIWNLLKGYQKQRLTVFFQPESDPLGAGYNVLQAAIAVGSGRFWGRGFGRGTQSHLRFLPEQHTDFIFATLAEEWGLIGVTLLLIFLMFLILRILFIAKNSSSSFGTYLCLGTAILLVVQVIINVGMNMGIMPVTGLPLPFVSYGGSAILAYSIALGFVHSVAVNSKA